MKRIPSFRLGGILFGLLFFAVQLFGQILDLQPHQIHFDSPQEAQRFRDWHHDQLSDPVELFFSAGAPQAAAERAALQNFLTNDLVDRLPVAPTFQRLRRAFFREYRAVASFGDALRHREFNCVSSSALTAMVLRRRGERVRVLETPRHIYVEVWRGNSWTRIETTSEGRALFHRKKRRDSWVREISLAELAGLQYFNAGLQALDDGEVARAFDLLGRAHLLYPSPRITDMLRHTAGRLGNTGRQKVLTQKSEAALTDLSRALVALPEDAFIQHSYAAALLQIAESSPDYRRNHQRCAAARREHPFLKTIPEFEQVYADLLLAVAWQALERGDTDAGLHGLAELERELSAHPEWVQPEMAGAVYGLAWATLVQQGQPQAAKELLVQGLGFAPHSESLGRKQKAMLAMSQGPADQLR
ncbi:MAG: hypothetical protein AAGN35_11915 [Bacteroidota bacterium]